MFGSNGGHSKALFITCAIALIFFFSLGCSMVGRVVPLSQRMELVGTGAKDVVFKNRDLNVIYSYDIHGSLLNITGKTYKPQGLDSFDLRLMFLDNEGKVLQQNLIVSVGFRSGQMGPNELNFQKTLQLPANTSGISFNYSGFTRMGRE